MIFYGWIVVGISLITLTVSYGARSSFSVFLVAMIEEFHWSRAALGAAFSIHAIVSMLGVPLGGMLVDHFGPRRVFPIGAIILGLGLVATSRLHSLWQFYLCFGIIMSFGRSLISMGPNAAIIANWFHRNRGAAMGIITAGPSVGMFVLSPLMQVLISTVGWRFAYLFFALLAFLLIPLILLFQRLHPAELGLHPDGVATAVGSPTSSVRPGRDIRIVNQAWAAEDWTPSKAVRTARFWALFSAFFFGNFTTIVLVHQVAFIVDIGYSELFAASIFGLIGAVASASATVFGIFSDRIGREMTYSIQTLCALVAILLLLLIRDTTHPWMLYVYAMVFGLGVRRALPAVAADIFQGKHFGAIYGILALGVGIGHVIGPWFAGYLYDAQHSYTIPFMLSMIGILLGCIAVWIAAPRKIRRVGVEGG